MGVRRYNALDLLHPDFRALVVLFLARCAERRIPLVLVETWRSKEAHEEDVARGAHPAVFRSNLADVLPQPVLTEIEAHPRFQAILTQFGVDDDWCDELKNMTNQLTAITGISVGDV